MRRRALFALPLGLATPALAQGMPRLVVAGGGIAEIVCALGARGAIVGADSTSLFPNDLRQLPQIGYLRALSAEGVLSLQPGLLLLAHEAGPPPAIAQLRAAGVNIIRAPRIESPETLMQAVTVVAEALGREARGQALNAALTEDFAALAASLPRPATPPSALFLLAAGAGAPMASGRGTSAEAMLRLAGARSAIQSYEGYRAVTAEAALAASPDWVVAPSHTVDGSGGVVSFLAQPQLSLLPAARAGRLVTFDSLYMLGFGPRTAHAARDLAAALHARPDLAALPERPWLRGAA